MPVKIEIFGDTAEQAIEEFRALNAVGVSGSGVAPLTPAGQAMALPLQDLKALVVARFASEGFEVSFSESKSAPAEEEPLPTITVESPPIVKRRGGRPPKVPPEAAKASLASKANGAGHHTPPIVEAAQVAPSSDDALGESVDVSADPEADRAFVLDTLNGIYKDPAQKAKVTEFTTKVAKINGGERLSALPADKFPAIRKQMETEFGVL